MVNILVPTDFSALSKVAVLYAVKIANKLDGNITLLHVITLEQKVKATLRMETNPRTFLNGVKDKFQELVEEVSQKSVIKKPINYKIVRGTSFTETALKESKKLKSGLIVMGTRGASGIKKALMGSNTASLIDVINIPVLAVPDLAEFKAFRNVIYATDLKNLEKELAVLIPYIKKFGSTIHILHIAENGSEVDSIEAKIDKIVQQTGYKNIVTLVTVDPDIDGAIDQYIGITNADLLAMFTHELSFYEKVFDKSVTRNMAFHSRIPLLAFKQRK